jgi:hypothetical protein
LAQADLVKGWYFPSTLPFITYFCGNIKAHDSIFSLFRLLVWFCRICWESTLSLQLLIYLHFLVTAVYGSKNKPIVQNHLGMCWKSC